jgi:peptidyl-prolyl cis-trans isomerase B (cyclophilin B)
MIVLHTNYGDISIELNYEKAPKSSKNFEKYVEDGFYNGVIFHRVINGFMVQGGGFEPGMTQKETRAPIENEADNGLTNDIGTLAMARTMDPHSASAQFFINVSNNSFLNHKAKTPDGWGYAVFGKVTAGIDVVNKIKEVATTSKSGHQDVPVDDVIIESAEVIKEA